MLYTSLFGKTMYSIAPDFYVYVGSEFLNVGVVGCVQGGSETGWENKLN